MGRKIAAMFKFVRNFVLVALLAFSGYAAAATQYGVAVNNARLDAIETSIGTSPYLQFYTGSKPANCATTATGTLLAELALPSDWMSAASSASKAKLGTWSGTGSASGTIGYFRIVDNSKATCGMQGTVTATGGGGDITVDNTSIASSQAIQVTSFTLNAGNQ
jgi:hypothetical protein